MDDERFRVYAVAIPDTQEAFDALIVNGSYIYAWDEITDEPVSDKQADHLVSKVAE